MVFDCPAAKQGERGRQEPEHGGDDFPWMKGASAGGRKQGAGFSGLTFDSLSAWVHAYNSYLRMYGGTDFIGN